MSRSSPNLLPFRLLGILDHPDPRDASRWKVVRAALDAGLPALMLRDRVRPGDELRDFAHRLREETRDRGARLIINRRPDLAREVGADGIHVGHEDPHLRALREGLGGTTIIGYSSHDETEACGALENGADYVTFSPVFPTPSKAGRIEPVGVERLSRLCERACGPVLALGGIDASNADAVMAAGAYGLVAIRGIFGAGVDTGIAVRELLLQIDRSRSG